MKFVLLILAVSFVITALLSFGIGYVIGWINCEKKNNFIDGKAK